MYLFLFCCSLVMILCISNELSENEVKGYQPRKEVEKNDSKKGS